MLNGDVLQRMRIFRHTVVSTIPFVLACSGPIITALSWPPCPTVRDVYSGSLIRIFPSRILDLKDPGSRVQGLEDPGSRV